MLDKAAVTYQIVLTKVDKISFKALKNQETSILNEVKNHAAAYNEIIATSSEKNIGLEELRAEINKLI